MGESDHFADCETQIRAALEADIPQQAMETLVRCYQHVIFGHCRSLLGSLDAEELAQEVLVMACEGLAGFAWKSSLRTWVFSITKHVCAKYWRRRSLFFGIVRKHPEDVIASAHRNPPRTPEQEFEATEQEVRNTQLLANLKRLPKYSRNLLTMRYFWHYTYTDIAVEIRVSEAQAYREVRKAEQRLRATMEKG